MCICFQSPPCVCLADIPGWWFKAETGVMASEGQMVTTKFVIRSTTYYGNSANIKEPGEDNWTCIIAGPIAFS
jgi:hypothetical protein